MAAIRKRLGRSLVALLSGLSALAALSWFVVMIYLLITADSRFSELQARAPASPDAHLVTNHIEIGLPESEKQDLAAPFGWVIGQTSCTYAQSQFQKDDDDTYAVFGGYAWSAGPKMLSATGIPGLLGLALICSEQDVVAAVLLTFAKSRGDIVGLQAMANDLDRHYTASQPAGEPEHDNGSRHVFGLWQARNATIDLQYISTDRRFDLSYVSPCYAKATKQLDAIHNKQSVEEQQQIRDDATASLDICMRELQTELAQTTDVTENSSASSTESGATTHD